MKLLITMVSFILVLSCATSIIHADDSIINQKLYELATLIDNEPSYSFMEGVQGKKLFKEQIDQAILMLENDKSIDANKIIRRLFFEITTDNEAIDPIFKEAILRRLLTYISKNDPILTRASTQLPTPAQSNKSYPQEIISTSTISPSNISKTIAYPEIAVASDGNWYIVYWENIEDSSSGLMRYNYEIKYISSKSLDPVIIDSVHYSGEDGNSVSIGNPSIAIDTQDNIHVTYTKRTVSGGPYPTPTEIVHSIMYATNISGAWSHPKEVISVSGIYLSIDRVIGYPKIVVDSDGNWYIAYWERFEDFSSGHLGYNSREIKCISSKSLDPVVIDSTHSEEGGNPVSIGGPSLAIDTQNNIHVTYSKRTLSGGPYPLPRETVYYIMYAANISGAWSRPKEIISLSYIRPPDIIKSILDPKIAVDPHSNWYIVYSENFADYSPGHLGYSSTEIKCISGKSLDPVIIDSIHADEYGNPVSIGYSSIAIDTQNNIHVTYTKRTVSWGFPYSTPTEIVHSIMYVWLPGQPYLETLDGVDFTTGGQVSDDPVKLATTKGASMLGAVTDGVARLLLRMRLDEPGSVTFSTPSAGNPEEDGTLRSIDGFLEGSSISVDSIEVNGKNYAFAVYRAPDRFVRGGNETQDEKALERKITIKAELDSGASTQKDIKLVRPPLILIHGLWSSLAMWAENGFRVKLGTAVPGLRMFMVNYINTNDCAFTINKYKMKNEISKAKGSFRANKIAMIQADVLGHSMGGLLARIWAGTGKGTYYRDDNFNSGDIHKLITLDSPHYGSFLADLCMNAVDNSIPAIRNWIVTKARSMGKPIDGGAARDLMTKSGAIENMNGKEISAAVHAIIGDYIVGSSMPVDLSALYLILELFCDPKPYIINGHSDLVVSVASQGGGLNLPASTAFDHYHTNATTDNVVNEAAELLNSSSNSSLFGNGFSN